MAKPGLRLRIHSEHRSILEEDGDLADDKLSTGLAQLMVNIAEGNVQAVEDCVAVNPALMLAYDDEGGWNAALQCAFYGQMDCLDCVVDHGVDVTALDDSGRDSLMLAAAQGHTQMVAHIIEQSFADPHLRAHHSQATALHMAAAGGHFGVAQHLMDAGALVSIKNAAGKTALDIAASHLGDEAPITVLLRTRSDLVKSTSADISATLLYYLAGFVVCVGFLWYLASYFGHHI